MKVTPVEAVPGAVRLEHTGSVAEHPLYQQGWFHVQDLSSQVCVLQGALRPGMRVSRRVRRPRRQDLYRRRVDGKSGGPCCAYDLYKGKGRADSAPAQSGWGSPVCRPLCGTRKPPPFPPEPADVVFCDAPCSGLGILRRKPEIRYKKPESLDRAARPAGNGFLLRSRQRW